MVDNAGAPETWRNLRQPKCDPALATKSFHEALIRDCLRYKNGDDAGREGVARALVHTINFLNQIGIPNPVTEPLDALALALLSLSNGTVHDLLKPNRPAGSKRPPRSHLDDAQEGVIAAIAEGFWLAAKSSGRLMPAAMRQAAQAMNASKQFPNLTATRVGNIRTRVKADRDTFARDQFDALVLSEGFLADPVGFVRSYLKAPLGGGNVNLRK